MSRRATILLVLSLTAPAALHVLAGPAPAAAAPSALTPDSYLPVSDDELAAALAEPAVRCVAAPTPTGCAADPAPADPAHPDPPRPASAAPGA